MSFLIDFSTDFGLFWADFGRFCTDFCLRWADFGLFCADDEPVGIVQSETILKMMIRND